MAGRATNGESVWEGAEWASPERAERIATRPESGRHDPIWGLLCRSLQDGRISPEGFRKAAVIRMTYEQQQEYLATMGES